MGTPLIAPSILSADFAKLGEEIQDVERGGADWVHIDVMDGQFVPNLSLGPVIISSIRPCTSLFFDVHLMIENPDQYVPDFVKSGADLITVHAEACRHLHRSVYRIKEQGVLAGVALNPATPISVLEHVLQDIDLVLIMTVNPGFGGQSFIDSMLPKIRSLRQVLDHRGLSNVMIEVDGGINEQTAVQVTEAGAQVLVAGNAIFGEKDRKASIAKIRGVVV